MPLRLLRLPVAALLVSFLVVACGDDDDPAPGANDPVVCVPPPAPQKPAASCDVTIELPPIPAQASTHRTETTPLTYCSNPPSSGPHYPSWADFKEYATPVPDGYLVHSMEHGAVVLFYKCDPPGCPDVVDGLRRIRDTAAPADERCAAGVKRVILVPSTTIPTQVAAAAWGATYQAPCLDTPTLEAFLRDHYRKGPEDICFAGQATF